MSRVVLAIAFLTTSIAFSAECTKDELASARQHFAVGEKAFHLAELERAVDEFKAAYQACAIPLLLFNLGQAYRELKNDEKALYFYQQFLMTAPASEPRRAQAEELSVEVRTRMAAAKAPAPAVPPAPAPSPKPLVLTKEPAFRDLGRRKRIAGMVVTDTGVGLLALGTAFAVLSKQAGDAAYHPKSGVYDPNADARQSGYRAADITCFVVGGAAVVVGTTLWLIGRKQRRSVGANTPEMMVRF